MKTKIMATAFFVLLPVQALAKEHMKKFRWDPGVDGKPQIFLGAALVDGPKPKLLPAVGEFVQSSPQKIGSATVQGTWRQTIFKPGGEVAYATGTVVEGLPSPSDLRLMEEELKSSLQRGMERAEQLRGALQIFPANLEVRKNASGEWHPVWRVEYLSASGDRLKFLLLSREGSVIEEGELPWDGVDGRALVFPKGPKFSAPEERALRDLTGDGTVTGRMLRVISALDLKVWSPEFTFFFAQDDRRFDLGQAYYTIEEGYRWLKEKLGVQLDRPIDVKLHVGDNGVSNAAFYHQNTIYLGTGDGVTYKDLIRDPSVLIHEGIHAVVDAYAGLPSEGEGGSFNEGFADLFTALILDNPRMGEASYQKGPYRRTLEHGMKAYKDFKPGVYGNGSIIAATFWDMKPSLGTELTAKLAFRTLVRLGRGAKFDDLPAALRAAGDGILSPAQVALVTEAARNRGWKIQ